MRSSILLLTTLACSAPLSPPPLRPIENVAAPATVDPQRMGGFPLPPKQFRPQKYEVPLPGKLLSSVATMFELGFADPRGCEYRNVQVMVGSVWGTAEPMKTRGWVLPDHADAQWVIGWNGLIYSAVSVDGPADIQADVAAIIKTEHERYAKETANYHRFDTTGEDYNLSHASPTAAKVALLLQLGEGALAKQLWDTVALDERVAKLDDPFLEFAVDWAWSLFERAVTSHMRGDTPNALPSARLLALAAPAIEAKADRRKIKRRGDGTAALHVSFIDQLPLLIDDEARREKLGKRALPDPKALAAMDPTARTKLLIDNLDQVAARQWGQPGGVDLASDPIVSALIDVGPPAVEPLIEVLESDSRLTRSVHFWRDFARNRTLLGVHEAAYVALAGILEKPFFDPASTGDNLSARGPDGRRLVADKVRAYWDQWKNVALEQRWFVVLADDKAKPEDWVDAAAKITRPHNVMVRPSSTVFTTTVTSPSGKPGMRGDSLRSRQNPSVSDLMLRRLQDPALGEQACAFAVMFGKWDAALSKPAMKDQLVKATAASKGTLAKGRCIVELAQGLAEAGDPTAIDTYARWIATAQPGNDWLEVTVFEPMWLEPARASIKAAADALFADGSAWVPLYGGPGDRGKLLDTPLIKVAGFNRHVVAGLSNTRVVGTLTMGDNGSYSIEYTNGGSLSTGTDDKDPPPKGTTQSVRIADAYAWHLASHNQVAPRFQMYWPVAQRDAAFAQIGVWLAKQVAK